MLQNTRERIEIVEEEKGVYITDFDKRAAVTFGFFFGINGNGAVPLIGLSTDAIQNAATFGVSPSLEPSGLETQPANASEARVARQMCLVMRFR